MIDTMCRFLNDVLGLGLESHDLEWHHMAIRAVVVYVVVLGITRSGHKRFLGKGTAFDVIIGILLGSIASRAITGNAPFVPTLLACAVLVWLHAVFAWSAYRSRAFARAIEGDAVIVIRDGEKVSEALRDSNITDEDLQEALYTRGVKDLKHVDIARLERSGKVSIVKKAVPTGGG
jgi:uncharacterized membrane protein YcaP (DUF421 family)